MLRKQINEALVEATRAKDKRRISTLRLVNAAIKDRDIASRSSGKGDMVSEADIQQLLQKMIRQRDESSKVYADAGRVELAQQELEEIEIIRSFLPTPLSDEELKAAVHAVVDEADATCVRDMGKCMGTLKERYPGRMDFSKASTMLKSILCDQSAAQST